jgi:hypothetical protein
LDKVSEISIKRYILLLAVVYLGVIGLVQFMPCRIISKEFGIGVKTSDQE